MRAFLKTKKEVTAWLEKHKVKNHELIPNESYGFVVNVKSHVYLDEQNLNTIPVKFAHVSGYFYCDKNQLTSLKFCPVHVGGKFYCYNNSSLQNIQEITDFKDIYQHHQATKIKLAKERLAQKLSDQITISLQTRSKIKI